MGTFDRLSEIKQKFSILRLTALDVIGNIVMKYIDKVEPIYLIMGINCVEKGAESKNSIVTTTSTKTLESAASNSVESGSDCGSIKIAVIVESYYYKS